MGSKRGYQEQESREFVMQNCPHCKGLTVEASYYEHGVWYREFRCINCGRYYPAEVRSAAIEIPPDMMGDAKRKQRKPFKRISDDVLTIVKGLLDAGQCVSKAARVVGIHQASLFKIARRNGWQVVQGKSGPERGKNVMGREDLSG